MIRSLLTAVAIALAAPAAASPYCNLAKDLSQYLNALDYVPVSDLPIGSVEKPESVTFWLQHGTDRWVVSQQEGPRACIVDSGRGHAMDSEHVFMGAPV